MSSKLHEYIITDSIYDRQISVFIGSGVLLEEHLGDEQLRGAFTRGNYGICATYYTQDGEPKYVIWMPKFSYDPVMIGILTHEAGHATFDVMELVGIPLNTTTQEAYCYYQEAIVEQFVDKFKRKCFINHTTKKVK